tara:strand:- start:15243 stop:15596 length:354 start_codon:yes stop_codon:yes gene_type:complete
MFKTLFRLFVIVSVAGFIAACSSAPRYHNYMMSGQVVYVEDGKVVVCIGSEDGAKTGMVLDVFKVEYSGSMTDGTDNYSKNAVGEIQIDSIIDEHFSRGSIVKGNIEPNNVAELRGM